MRTVTASKDANRDRPELGPNEFVKSHDHVVEYLKALLQDTYEINPLYDRTGYLRDLKTIERRYRCEGLSFATKTLPGFFDSILNYLETGISSFPGFKKIPGTARPLFLRQLTEAIYTDPYSDNAALCIKHLYQLCASFKKLKGPYKKSVLVEQLNKFVWTDAALHMKVMYSMLSDVDCDILVKAKHLVDQILEGLNPFDPNQAEKFIPRPGPGATNSPIEKYMRYQPHTFYTQLAEVFDYEEWFFSEPKNYRGYKINNALKPSSMLDSKHYIDNLKSSVLLTSRFKFVHKTYGKPRCICIEEYEMQWLQQGVRRALYDRIQTHPLSRDYVRFNDQSKNGQLALQSSTGLPDEHGRIFATIDMSEGSDRIPRWLVEYLFGGNPELCKALLTLSTRIIELPKELHHRGFILSNKYAPMGSALCFPVMGLVHFVLIKSIISSYYPPHINDVPVYVYGDDIIVETKYCDAIYATLPHFGMKINVDKSFVKSRFRESCGVHAYNGMVVTPTRFKSIVTKHICFSEVITALKDEGALFAKGYKNTASLIRSHLEQFPWIRAKRMPYVGPKSPVVGFIRDDKTAAAWFDKNQFRRKKSERYQCVLYKARVLVKAKLDKTPPFLLDDFWYLRWQTTNTKEFTTRDIYDFARDDLKIHWQWLPQSAFFNA